MVKIRVEKRGGDLFFALVRRTNRKTFVDLRDSAHFAFKRNAWIGRVESVDKGLSLFKIQTLKLPTEKEFREDWSAYLDEIAATGHVQLLVASDVFRNEKRLRKRSKRVTGMDHKQWTAADINRLTRYFRQGWSDVQLAVILGRSEHAIRSQRQKLRLKVVDRGALDHAALAQTIVELVRDVRRIKEKLR